MGKSDSELVDLSGETLRKEPSYVVIGDRIEVLEGREAAPEIDEGCPCTLIEPCSVNCTCANPIMSGGCLRCCRYGSLEQRTAQAQRLTGEITEAMVEQAALVRGLVVRVGELEEKVAELESDASQFDHGLEDVELKLSALGGQFLVHTHDLEELDAGGHEQATWTGKPK